MDQMMEKTAFLYAGQGSQKPGMGMDFYREYETYRNFADRMFAAYPVFSADFSALAADKESGKKAADAAANRKPGESAADLSVSDAESRGNIPAADAKNEEHALAADLRKIMEEGPADVLSRTEYTQVCMGIFAAGVTQLLEEQGIRPDAACGLSLGEYGALYAAGAFSAEDYVRLLAFRGRAMAKAAEGTDTAMTAVMGALEESRLREICREFQDGFITAANFNCPGQTVLCGDSETLSQVEKRLKEISGVRCIRLKVSGPFHTEYMASAGEALASYFANSNLTVQPLRIPVAANATGTFYAPEEDVTELLVKQVQSSVFLEQDLRALIGAGYRNFIEIGPGKTMAGFLKKTAKAMGEEVRVQSIDSVEDFRNAAFGRK
ncbi:MAG: ACP S-malonyltransferase [Lachnospiraceae bacterium]|nr:ACP S-malonyltransferase [Lachnospiraceae bacterium]